MCISTRRSAHQSRICVWDQKSNYNKRDNEEQQYSPKHLLGSLWNGFTGIFGFRSSKAHELGTCKSKCGRDKDIAKTLEAIIESPRVMPVLSTNVVALRSTAAIQNNSKNSRFKLASAKPILNIDD